jgi:hypothetical protein
MDPVTHDGDPVVVPVLPLPDESVTLVPDPSFKW